jgi:hypothetical protein
MQGTMSHDCTEDLKLAAEALAGAKALLVCAGAGMGVDSGLPDFRGDDHTRRTGRSPAAWSMPRPRLPTRLAP